MGTAAAQGGSVSKDSEQTTKALNLLGFFLILWGTDSHKIATHSYVGRTVAAAVVTQKHFKGQKLFEIQV